MEKLKQYMKETAALEAQLYTQKELYWKLKHRADSLGIARSFKQPVRETVSVLQDPDYDEKQSDFASGCYFSRCKQPLLQPQTG